MSIENYSIASAAGVALNRGRFFVAPWQQVPVHVEREGHAGVAKPFADDLGPLPLGSWASRAVTLDRCWV